MTADYAARVMKLGGGHKELRLMNAFRAFLILIIGGLGAYTVATELRNG